MDLQTYQVTSGRQQSGAPHVLFNMGSCGIWDGLESWEKVQLKQPLRENGAIYGVLPLQCAVCMPVLLSPGIV